MKRPVIFPEFLKKLDHYLLQHYPVLWASRLHFLGYVVVVSCVIAMLVVAFLPIVANNAIKCALPFIISITVFFTHLDRWPSGFDMSILKRFSRFQLLQLWGYFMVTSGFVAFVICLMPFVDNIKLKFFFTTAEIETFERVNSLEKYQEAFDNFSKIEDLDEVLDDRSPYNYLQSTGFKNEVKEFVQARRRGIEKPVMDSITYEEILSAADSLYRLYWPEAFLYLASVRSEAGANFLRSSDFHQYQLTFFLWDNNRVEWVKNIFNKPRYNTQTRVQSVIDSVYHETAFFKGIANRKESMEWIAEKYREPFPVSTFLLIWVIIMYFPTFYISKLPQDNVEAHVKDSVGVSFLLVFLYFIGAILLEGVLFHDAVTSEKIPPGLFGESVLAIASYIFFLFYSMYHFTKLKNRALIKKSYYIPFILLWGHLIISFFGIIKAYSSKNNFDLFNFLILNTIVFVILTTYFKKLDALPRRS